MTYKDNNGKEYRLIKQMKIKTTESGNSGEIEIITAELECEGKHLVKNFIINGQNTIEFV